MSKKGDYIPSTETGFLDWLDNFVEKVQANAEKWQIPKDEVTELVRRRDDFKQKHAKCAGPDRTMTLVKEKDAALKAAKDFVRAMVRFRFANPAITDAELISAGLHPRDKTRTPIGAPNSRCLITDLKPLGGDRVEIHLQDEDTPGSRAVPYGCNGALMHYAYGPERITTRSLLNLDTLITNNPFTLQLPPEAEGSVLSLAVCWQSSRGFLGPWSEIMYIVVS